MCPDSPILCCVLILAYICVLILACICVLLGLRLVVGSEIRPRGAAGAADAHLYIYTRLNLYA